MDFQRGEGKARRPAMANLTTKFPVEPTEEIDGPTVTTGPVIQPAATRSLVPAVVAALFEEDVTDGSAKA